MAVAEKNYYRILGITRTAGADEIKRAWRHLAMKHHPDKNQGNSQSEELFKEIQEAYYILSDAEKRRKYDLAKSWNFSYSYFQQVHHYFIVHADNDFMKLNEEFKITFTYTGEGRFFQKPAMPYFFITGKPYVSFRRIIIDGTEVKETSLEYTVAPIKPGDILIESATIRINQEVYQTDPLKIHVMPAPCYYMKGALAGDHPLKYPMNAEIQAGTETHQVTYYQNHTVVIPRSEAAWYYHSIGSVIKVGSTLWGMFLFSSLELNAGLGIMAGSLFGGICCHTLYLMTGVKSKFFYSTRHPVVLKYEARGYQKGRYSGSRYLTGNLISWIGDLFI